MNCKIRVVDKTRRSCDVECDRHYGRGMDQQSLGQPGCFGNPYKMDGQSLAERRRVISKFADFWLDQWQNDQQLRSWWAVQVREHDELRLGCHCNPKPCHADVIRATLINAFDLDGPIESPVAVSK